ncbi:VCBS repeat-containing protein [Luteolibacter yonseiensis]|uniref:VCBS repeat-containing protein n=1 Tax=Luteolibacter yonseiensis TaxID=1144680 RepID=A0A934VBQ4_9BACT|nr:VCBS repeat-containing protein [Luteolibacter yonseiensis]MBK1816350.1 VCBS repeat-containing protein [Luteolibacter yonseiensis]
MTRAFFILALALFPAAVRADNEVHRFKRIQLSDQFWCEGANTADFNRDGHADLVAGPWWWEGPAFAEKHEIYEASATFKLPLGDFTTVDVPGYEGGLGHKNAYSDNFFAFPYDFNADGWTDVLVIGFPGKNTTWYENPKDAGGRWVPHVIFYQTDNESPDFTDITGDGKPELVCITDGAYGYAGPDWADPAKPWRWHAISPKNGYGKFTHGMGVGDVDGDGRRDLLEQNGWWEQPEDSNASWTFHSFPFAGTGGAQMYAYDVDGDGLNDVITGLAAHGFGLAWYQQVRGPDGVTFKKHLIMGQRKEENRYGVKFSELHAIDLVDIDGDGLRDIVTGKRFWSHGRMGDPDRNDRAVSYWFQLVRSEQGVDWVPHLIDDNSGVGTQVVARDIDGDKLPDVLVGNKKGIFILRHEVEKVGDAEYTAARPKPLEVIPAARDFPALADNGQPLNFDFETGALANWTAEGTAFSGSPVKGDVVNARRKDMTSGHHGEFWAGSYEAQGSDKPTGTLTSDPFTLSQPWVSFLVGGGSGDKTRVEIVNASNGLVLFTATGPDDERMARRTADLAPYQGARIRIRLVDEATDGWGHLNFDHFQMHDREPVP